jgi:NADPH2:quinone reductase
MSITKIGLNRGELKFADRWPAGAIHDHDAAGVVMRAAAGGSADAIRALFARAVRGKIVLDVA